MKSNSVFKDKNFFAIGTMAIVAGGLLSAFSASSTTFSTAWATAYLVLIVGIAQIIIGGALELKNTNITFIKKLAFGLLYNIGSVLVLVGTIEKHTFDSSPYIVDAGGMLIISSLIVAAWSVRNVKLSSYASLFYSVLIIVLISTPIGMLMAHR